MVAGDSAVMPGQLAAWHSLYLAHPAEQFTSTHKQDLVIYDCPPRPPTFFFPRFSAARVWIGRDKANGCRGACDGAQSMCYLCLFSVTALASGRQTLAAVWLDTYGSAEEERRRTSRPLFTNEATLTACKISINPSGLFGHQRHNDVFFVTYADGLCAWDVILAAAPTCGQNEKRSRRDSFRGWSALALWLLRDRRATLTYR